MFPEQRLKVPAQIIDGLAIAELRLSSNARAALQVHQRFISDLELQLFGILHRAPCPVAFFQHSHFSRTWLRPVHWSSTFRCISEMERSHQHGQNRSMRFYASRPATAAAVRVTLPGPLRTGPCVGRPRLLRLSRSFVSRSFGVEDFSKISYSTCSTHSRSSGSDHCCRSTRCESYTWHKVIRTEG